MSKIQAFSKHKRKIKFINFFLCLRVIFALLDPYPDTGSPLNLDPIRIHNTGQHTRLQ